MLRVAPLEREMDLITAFLNTPLYSPKTESHVPAGTVCISGTLNHQENGGIQIQATGYRNLRGQELEGEPKKLFLPMHKIDHIVFGE